jgi:hypothetical protein
LLNQADTIDLSTPSAQIKWLLDKSEAARGVQQGLKSVASLIGHDAFKVAHD